MHVVVVALLILSVARAEAAVPDASQSSARAGECNDWHDCRQRALEAAERHDYEAFHDLAWRAVQTGPPKDPALMYLLARAQALSARPHDALIMIQRLAEIGVTYDAETNEDLAGTRRLPGWPEVEGQIQAVRNRVAARAVTASVVATPTATATAGSLPSVRAEDPRAVHFSSQPFPISGLAYDSISSRFVLADRTGRRLVVVDEHSKQAMDLVRAESTGFLDIAALEIDAKRGDLWVASTGAADGAGTLHRIQLLSGRSLRAFRIAPGLESVNLVDLAVGANATVVVLDARAPQLFVLRPGATALDAGVKIDVQDATSVAVGADSGVAFVAHRDGLSRIDWRTRSASVVSAPNGVSLHRLERIRWHGTSLIATQLDDDGVRHVVRLDLNGRGTAVTQATRLTIPTPVTGQTFVTISGDDLVYLTAAPDDKASDAAQFIVYRTPLR